MSFNSNLDKSTYLSLPSSGSMPIFGDIVDGFNEPTKPMNKSQIISIVIPSVVVFSALCIVLWDVRTR